MTASISTKGTVFQIQETGYVTEPDIYITIPEVISIGPVEVASDTLEVTALNSDAKEYIQGMVGASTLQIEMNWINSGYQQQLRGRVGSVYEYWYRIIRPDGSNTGIRGRISDFSISSEPNAPIVATFTIAVNKYVHANSLRWALHCIGLGGGWHVPTWTLLPLNQNILHSTFEVNFRKSYTNSTYFFPWWGAETYLACSGNNQLEVFHASTFSRVPIGLYIRTDYNHHVIFDTDGAGNFSVTLDGVEVTGTMDDGQPGTGTTPSLNQIAAGQCYVTFWDWKISFGGVLNHHWPLIGDGAGDGATPGGFDDVPITGDKTAVSQEIATSFWWQMPIDV